MNILDGPIICQALRCRLSSWVFSLFITLPNHHTKYKKCKVLHKCQKITGILGVQFAELNLISHMMLTNAVKVSSTAINFTHQIYDHVQCSNSEATKCRAKYINFCIYVNETIASQLFWQS